VKANKALGLSCDNRIRVPGDFHTLKQEGLAVFGKHVLFVRGKNTTSQARMGVVVTRQTGGAVIRNRWKRVLRDFFRCRQSECEPGVDYLWVVKRSTKGKPGPSITGELEKLFDQSFRRHGLLSVLESK